METSGEQGLTANEIFIGKLVNKYVFPSVCALLGTQLSGLINGIIIGNILGGTGLSAIALVAPVPLVYLSIGSLVGVGSSIISGIALGKGDRELCAKVYTLSYIVCLSIALILTTAGLLNLDRIVRFLGANAEQFSYTRSYVRFYISGGSGILLLYIPLNYLRITGKPNLAMVMLLFMSFINILGLVVFVILLGLGTGGAALALVSGGTAAFFFGLSRLGGKDSPLKFRKPGSVARRISELATVGSPSALNNVCRAVQYLGINLLLVRMGAGAFLPCYVMLNAVSDFMLAIILGISQAALPLVSVSFGERDFRSIRIILKKALFLGNIIIGIFAAIILLTHNKISFIFGMRDEAFLPVAAAAFVFLALSLNLAFINSIMINYFNAIRRVFIANILVVSRLVLFMVLPAYLLFSSMGIYAVWISLIAAEALTLSLVLPLLRIVRRRQSQLSKYLLLDNTLIQNSKVIDFSVKSTVTDITSAAAKISGFCEENEVSPKKIMRISLAIEEMLLLINEFSFSPDRTQYTDVRIMVTPESIVLRIRNSGAYFNPVRYYYENKDTEAGAQRTLGMVMILKMAVSVEFRETFGMNNLIITI